MNPILSAINKCHPVRKPVRMEFSAIDTELTLNKRQPR
jgi:hypothetical protein